MASPDEAQALLEEMRRQLDEAVEKMAASAAWRAERHQELHDWIHGRTDRLEGDFDRELMCVWGFDPDKPWAEQDE